MIDKIRDEIELQLNGRKVATTNLDQVDALTGLILLLEKPDRWRCNRQGV